MQRIPASRGPSSDEAARVRAQLMSDLAQHVRRQRWSRSMAARRCGLTPPRYDELMAGDTLRFTLEDLVGVATQLGLRVEITHRTRPTPIPN